MEEQDLWLTLARAPRLAALELQAAVAALGGDVRAVLAAPARLLREAGFAPATVAWLAAPDRKLVEADRRWLEKSGATLVNCLGASYPPQLQEIPGAPATLFVLGAVECLLTAQLAIVGSRNPTATGRRTAAEFAASLARTGLVITSGLALGIDAACHEGALDAGGRTIAVLGSGLDTLYPPEHRALAERILARGGPAGGVQGAPMSGARGAVVGAAQGALVSVAQGALVSEFPPGVPPLREHFPRRNRLISGLSLGTLVVEAARHSGSLITARLAGEQGREVFAIPGSIHNPLSRGCHQLLRAGAKLVETVDDVLSELKLPFTKQQLAAASGDTLQTGNAALTLDKDYKILLDALGFEPTGMDVLALRTGLETHSVASMLLILELEGRVASHPGGRYMRV
jgi:DNA processing protein